MELRHKCSYGTECIEMAIKIAKERDTGHKRTEEEVHEDIHTSVREVARMLTQARLGLNLERRQKQRLLWGDQSKRIHIAPEEKEELVSGYSWTTEDVTKHEVSSTKTMLWEKEANVIYLAGLKIFPRVGEQVGESIVGTLEVHVNGFYYATSSPNFSFSFFYADVQRALFRLGDEKAPPLLHFRFHDRIKVGTEKRRSIQFRLAQTRVGQKRSYNDSYKINEDLKNFIHNVGEKWRGIPLVNYFPFNEAEVCKADEFQGNRPSKAPTVFSLTFSTLVGLVDEPFIVVDLGEIEVVHLRLKPELSKPTNIDMTVVLRDLARDLVQINSIPIDKLDFIKDRCNIAGVKYYENDYDINWGSIRKEMADSRQVADWRCFEKPETRNYYNAGHPVYCSPYGEAFCGSDNEEASDLED